MVITKTNKNRVKIQLTAMALSTALLSGTASADTVKTSNAPDDKLDPVLVTAQRYEKRDVDTPATTSVYSGEKLQETGAKNVLEALKLTEGFVYSGYGASGASQGTMTSKVIMRGVYSGTLVLINGTPINIRGLYNLEDIPLENVERVEIVRGGGSVLYGSEATGGVINIITKKERQNSITVSEGNYGQQDYDLNLQMGKLGMGYNYEKWGNAGKASSYVTSGKEMYNIFAGLERNNYSFNYNFDTALSLLYDHSDSKSRYNYCFGEGYASNLADKTRYTRNYYDNKNLVQLQYHQDHVKGTVYYNDKNLETLGVDSYSSAGSIKNYPQYTDTEEKNRTYGLDLQQDWQINANKLLLGLTYQNEYYLPNVSKSLNYERNNYSVYGQWEQPFNDVNTMILSGRETWTGGAPNDKNYDNFSSQGQFIHKINENESIYTSAGQSFKMPTFSQIYGSSSSLMVGNPNVKPQTGMHYEVGWKKNSDHHQWRVALFNYYIKDNITSQNITTTDQYQYTNEDLKNTGIELSCNIEGTDGWSYNWGVTYGNPQSKTTAKPYWDRTYGRWQVNSGVTYQKDKWRATLTESYLADRVMTPSSAASYGQKPYLMTSFNVDYEIDKKQDIFFTANNVLDRDDVISHQSSEYYYTPFNYSLGYKAKF
ncbi:iron complex outermembrane receptor protein [Sporomusaceae bacterium BoRhaA]|uniref:TonB-dependent receptor plug domain-containing protein n=1 Tax=Pelorhabdus rhamnosifermentans TaxID=2772457 RepID=UPI001C0622F3|nr:TonB-dependent receptor [Pelorhabdus rhamnosifermentans]MBU2700295.1 iron complex outermembrane receptor protein [Pelorhabdus rhamnosifermentans]